MCMFHTYRHFYNMCYGTFRLQVYELTFMSGGVRDSDGDGTTARKDDCCARDHNIFTFSSCLW